MDFSSETLALSYTFTFEGVFFLRNIQNCRLRKIKSGKKDCPVVFVLSFSGFIILIIKRGTEAAKGVLKMEDIFQTEMTTTAPPENDFRLFLRETIQAELKRHDRKQKKRKKNKREKAKKKAKKGKKLSSWEKIAIRSAQIAIESGIPALFRKWEFSGQQKVTGGGK